ncbi:MAG: hypothetical protein WCV88_06305, partial [Patescibacteria group bacterium]
NFEQPFGGVASVKNIGEYIQLVYQFALGIVGIIAVTLIMFGGVRWIAAAGNESMISEAKETIISAVTGLVIALLSYTILAFINPQTLKTDVSVFKIPVPTITCANTPTLTPIPTIAGLAGNGAQACPGTVLALQEIATKMRDVANKAEDYYCPTCTIQVGSAYRTPQEQAPMYACYQKCVEEKYIKSDGSKITSGAPSGCSYCAKTAAPCCSNHNYGTAVDVYFTTGGYMGLKDIPSSDAGDASKNNGGMGGSVNYGSCDTTKGCNEALFLAQGRLYDIMISTKKFTNFTGEWWHFDFNGKCDAVPTDCKLNAAGTMSSNYMCQSSDGKIFEPAWCISNLANCLSLGDGVVWQPPLQICKSTEEYLFNPAKLVPGTDITISSSEYTERPTCVTIPVP